MWNSYQNLTTSRRRQNNEKTLIRTRHRKQSHVPPEMWNVVKELYSNTQDVFMFSPFESQLNFSGDIGRLGRSSAASIWTDGVVKIDPLFDVVDEGPCMPSNVFLYVSTLFPSVSHITVTVFDIFLECSRIWLLRFSSQKTEKPSMVQSNSNKCKVSLRAIAIEYLFCVENLQQSTIKPAFRYHYTPISLNLPYHFFIRQQRTPGTVFATRTL